METRVIILGLLLVIVSFLYIRSILKMKKVKKELLSIEDPKRVGYYKMDCSQGKYSYTGIYNVIEVDRYKNGDSRIKLKKIELANISHGKVNNGSAIAYLNRTFSSIKKTSDIEWLDSVEDVKEIRRLKLEKIKTIFKN